MQTTIGLLHEEYVRCPRLVGWAYSAHLEQFLDLLLYQQLLGRRMLVLLVADGSDSQIGVNFVHLT